MASEDALAPSVQAYLKDSHENILALPGALSDWEQSLQDWKKALDDWASSLHQPADVSWSMDLDLGDYQDMLGHYQRAEKVLTQTQGEYQALLQEVFAFLRTPHYYTALTTPQLQQQAMSLAQTLVEVANNSAVTQAHALQKAEQVCQRAHAHNERAQDQLATAHKKWVRKQVVAMAHTLDHQPLLDFLAGKGRKYINAKDAQGKTALQHAVARNEPDIVQWLLDHGAAIEAIEAKDEDGLTPLHWAAKQGHTVIAELLLTRGADREARNNRHSTPLHFAAQDGHTATVALLLDRNANIEAKNQVDATPLHFAAQNGHTATVALLLAHSAAIEAKDQWNYTPLHRAALQGHTATVALLLDRGAAIEAKDQWNCTPLHEAALQGHTATVALLLDRGAAIEAKDQWNYTPLHQAAKNGHTATVALLLDRGAAIEAKNQWNYTPLHRAAQNGHTATTVALLLARGASLTVKNNNGKTPLDIAVESGHEGIATLLRAAHAPGFHPRYHVSIAPGAEDEAVSVDHPGLFSMYSWKVSCYQKAGHWHANVNYGDKYATHVPIKSSVPLSFSSTSLGMSKANINFSYVDHSEGKREYVGINFIEVLSIPNETDAPSQAREERQQVTHVPEHPPTRLVAPTPAASAPSPLPPNVKDAPELVQAKTALSAAVALHQSAQETAAAVAQSLQEAQVTKEHARCQSQASVLHLQTMQQHVAHLLNAPPEPRCVTYYLKPITDEAKDYLQSLADGFAFEEQQKKGNDLLAELYTWRQQEQQHYRHVEQLFLCDTTLPEEVQAQLLGEVLPQHQCHIDILGELIHRLVETGHVVKASDFVLPSASLAPEAVAPQTDPLHVVSFEQDVAVLLRIVQLGATLPESLQETFQESIAPILQEKLLQASPVLQDQVFHYFQKQGALYPKVLRQYPVQAWVFMSLFHDLAQGTALADAVHVRFSLLAEKLKEQYPSDVLTAVLWELKNKKAAHMLSLDELCDVMDMLPEEGAEAQALLCLPSDQWRTRLKQTWLCQAIEGCCPHLNIDQRQHLMQELSHLDWSLQATQTLLQQLPQDHNPEELRRLLAFTAQHPIEDALLLKLLTTPAPAPDNVIAHWRHQLACGLLKEKLPKLLPQEIQESTYAMIEKLWAHTPAYRSINSLLEQLFLKKLQEDGFTLNAEHLHLVLAMAHDYRLDEDIYDKLLRQLTNLPSHQWQQHLYTQILQHCFAEEVHERTVPEMIEYIAHHSPEVAYAQDRVAFAQAHQAILEAYQAASKVLPGKQAIASWNAATITQWAQTVKDYAKNPGKYALPTQSELIAVVKRAVELYHGYSPRNTQLLSLLVLLNTTPGQGRLVQINTGEGKSLTVAMFSAIKALLNSKSDIVTTSTELSIPEVDKQRPFFEMLALSVSENSDKGQQESNKKKQQAYQQDNVYGAPADFQGDILRGEFFGKELRMQRPFDCVVVDEVDNMLFDSRSHSIRLSSTMPATNHLEILLAATWQRVKYVSSHLIKDQDQVYCIEEDFQKDENGHITILSGEERDPKKCMHPIEGTVEDFIKEKTQAYLELLLRDLATDEKEAYQASKKLEHEITLLRTDLANEKDPGRNKEKADQLEQLEENHKALPWNKKQYPPIVSVPAHLKNLAKQQVPRWIQSAITAALVYKKGCHYDVHDGKIVPVDYDNTGVWQHNMVWSNGLAQFLQIKEGLKVSPENISTNFISTVGFFQRYAKQLYGLTGTLGNEVTQEFFKKVYNTDLVIVPPYKQRLIVGNQDSRYACKELTPQIITDKNIDKWYDAIEASALQHAQQQRAVLIICKYIRQVHALEARLQQRYTRDKIFTYTGKKKFKKDKVYPGEIIIATNIAGRGTDLTPTELVEHHGGLHVCITFLPESYRVELQNAGRTARQGSKGTTQLILHQPDATTIAELRQQRDAQEAKDLQKAINEVERMTFKDELFQRFCQVENKLIPTLDGFERLRQSHFLEQLWEDYAQDSLSTEVLTTRYENHVNHCVQAGVDAIANTQWSSLSYEEKQAQKATIAQAVRTAEPFSEFQKKYTLSARREAIKKLQEELGSQNTLHPDIVKAFQEGRKYVPENGELAAKHGWGPHERKAVEERFGLWFHQHIPQGKEPINFDTTRADFETFLQEIEKDAKDNNLIHNAFFYVQKGNYLLQSSDSRAAIAAYNKAIALDPDFSLNARYNKARALLTPEENKHNHTEAKSELREAKILVDRYKNDLFTFQSIIGLVQPPKPQTAQHLQHHLDILFQQDHHIDAAIGVIELAQKEGNHVKITKNTEVDALFDQDAAQEPREQALAESYENGLAYFFTIEEKKPRPWFSICAVALIGLVQIAAATLATIGTAGMLTAQLLKSGISDLITAISSAISGQFSWKEWGISKAISIGISIVSAGISQGWSSLKNSVKEFGGNLKESITSLKGGVLNTKDAFIKQVKEVALNVGKGVGKECANILLNQVVQEIAGEALEEKITNQVSQKIMQSMLKSDFIRRAMANDIARRRDYWAQIFIKEGLAMLSEKDSAWYTILQGIIKGTALQQLTQHIEELYAKDSSKTAILTNLASAGLPMLSDFLTDINGFTDTFLANFHKRLEQKYGQELAKMETKTSATKQPTETDTEEAQAPEEQEFMHVIDAQVHFDDDELQLHELNNGQAFSTQAKMTPQQVAIDPKSSQEDRARTLGNALTGNVTAQLLGKVNQHLINPLTSLAAGAFIDFATSGITKRLREEREKAELASQISVAQNKHANQQAREEESRGTTTQVDHTSDNSHATQNPTTNNHSSVALPPSSTPNEDVAEQSKPQESNITQLGGFSAVTKKTIEVRKDGVYQGCIGTKYRKNGVIRIDYESNPNPTENNHGHYTLSDGTIVINASNDANCCMNAIAVGLSESERKKLGINSGKDLFNKLEAHRLAHPAYAMQSDIGYQALLHHNPAALLRGGSPQDVEMIYAWHELNGTEPDWAAMGAADLGFVIGLAEVLGKTVVNVSKLPVDLACGLVGLFEDPQSTVEATLAKIKAIPAYVKEAPAAFKEYINAIQAIEDPYEQGRALGKLLGGVMPTGAAAGGVVSKAFSKLGRWARRAKLKTRQGGIGKKSGAKGSGGKKVVTKVERIDKILEGSSKNVQETYSSAKAWLGEDCRIITKDSGDIILISKDGLRKLRFDIKNPHPHTNPHAHIEILKNGKWEEIKWEGKSQLYPKDVPKN